MSKWLMFDWTNRKQHAFDMLSKLHLNTVPMNELETFMEQDMKDLPECKKLLEETMEKLETTESDDAGAARPTYPWNRKSTSQVWTLWNCCN